MKYLIISLFILFSACKSKQKVIQKNVLNEKPYVIMLSLDGFRWDYTDMVETPNLDAFVKNGVKAESLKPCFPTKTFPNHYSIATGLYPDNHGIVNNSFYDAEMDAYYRIRDRQAVENGEFYGGEPIWVTAEKQGIISASFFWVGSEAKINGHQPTYWKRYEHKFPYQQRIDSVIYWLNLPEQKRPHLITFYFDQPDGVGHKHGPNSKGIRDKVKELDRYVGIFLEKVRQLPIANQINIIITSDHGMAELSKGRIILNQHIKPEWLDKYEGSNPCYNLKAKAGYVDSVFNNLKKAPQLNVAVV